MCGAVLAFCLASFPFQNSSAGCLVFRRTSRKTPFPIGGSHSIGNSEGFFLLFVIRILGLCLSVCLSWDWGGTILPGSALVFSGQTTLGATPSVIALARDARQLRPWCYFTADRDEKKDKVLIEPRLPSGIDNSPTSPSGRPSHITMFPGVDWLPVSLHAGRWLSAEPPVFGIPSRIPAWCVAHANISRTTGSAP